MRYRPFLLSAALLLITACGSDASSPTDPSQTLEHGTMSATVDGQKWTATVALQVAYQNGVLGVAGVGDQSITIGIGLIPSSGPGTYTISLGEATNASYSGPGGTGAVWQAVGGVAGSGSIVLTSLTTTGASGTFSFELPAVSSSGATGTKSVTDGKFDLKF